MELPTAGHNRRNPFSSTVSPEVHLLEILIVSKFNGRPDEARSQFSLRRIRVRSVRRARARAQLTTAGLNRWNQSLESRRARALPRRTPPFGPPTGQLGRAKTPCWSKRKTQLPAPYLSSTSTTSRIAHYPSSTSTTSRIAHYPIFDKHHFEERTLPTLDKHHIEGLTRPRASLAHQRAQPKTHTSMTLS